MIPLIGRRTGPVVVRSGPGESRLWDDGQPRTLAGRVGASWERSSNVWREKQFLGCSFSGVGFLIKNH